MPLPRDPNQIVQHMPPTNQQLQSIAGQSSFQDWIALKDRNAIPVNAPSLLWLEIKPGKRVYTKPFTIDENGVKASYTKSYWNDPKRIARMHEVIDNAPADWQAPDWLDVEGIENLYRYFEYRNPGANWEDWKELPGNDPGIDLANYLDQPPQDILHYDDMDPEYRAYRKIQDWYDNYNQKQAEIQAAMEQGNQAYAQLIEQEAAQDLVTRWEDLEVWQKVLLSRDSVTQIEGRPEWTRGVAASWMGFKTGLSILGLSAFLGGGIGTLAAPGPGTTAGLIAGGLAGLYTGIKAFRGEDNELAKLLNVFNLPAEAVERILGMVAMQREAAKQGKPVTDYGTFSDRWLASKSGYESQILPIGNWEANAVSKIFNWLNPDWSSGETAELSAGEVWQFEQGYVTPQVVAGGTMAGEALLEASARISSGEDATLVYEDMVRKYGYSGTRADFIAQNFLDPNQVVPFLVNRGGEIVSGRIGDQLLRQKFIEHRGSLAIDMLPMGWQQLATTIGKDWGWRSTSGIFDVLQDYGQALRTQSMAPDGSMILPENFSKFQIMVGQLALNKDGKLQPRNTIPDSELATPTNRIIKALEWAGRATPETKALQAQADLVSVIEHVMQLNPNNPTKMFEMLQAVADADNTKFPEIAGGYLASPQLESIRGAVRNFIESKELETSMKIWQATQTKRTMLQELAVATTHDLTDQMTAAKVMDLLKTGQTDELIRLIMTNPRNDNVIVARYKYNVDPETEFRDPSRYLSPTNIEKRLKTFIEDRTPWHPGEFAARTLNKMVDGTTDYLVQRYGLTTSNLVMRMSTLLKSAQSLYLLGLSPNFFINNLIDGAVNTAYYGVFGMKPLSQLDKFWTEYDIPKPARLGDSYGPGDVTRSIFTQINPKDLLTEAQGLIGKVNKNLGVFTRLSNKIEQIQGANAITLGAMQYLKRNWREGVGFGKMPANLESNFRKAGIDPEAIYAIARSSKSPEDFDKRFYGAYREGTIGRALERAIHRPPEPEGPPIQGDSPEERIAKFDNNLKEYSEEIYHLDGQPLTSELLTKTGIEEMIIDNLREGMDEDAAIGSALSMAEESLDRQRWNDRLSRIESDNGQITAEGFKAAVQVFGDQMAENLQKSSALRLRVAKGFDEVQNLRKLHLGTRADAYMLEVVEEVQRLQKVQADENRLRISTILNRLDENNPVQVKISEHLVEIGKAWDEFFEKKAAAYEEFAEVTRGRWLEDDEYARLKLELDTKLNDMATDTRAYEAGIQKMLDENYVIVLGKTPEQQQAVRTWLSNVRNLEAQLHPLETKIFKEMADNPTRKNQIYMRYMQEEYMPMVHKIQDVYSIGAKLVDIANEPQNVPVTKYVDEIYKTAGIDPKTKVETLKTEVPDVEPRVVIADLIIKPDEVDARIARTIYLDQAQAVKRDTETMLRIKQVEESFIEQVKRAFPDMARNRGKLRLAMTWLRMRSETWAIDNDSTPLDFWRVYGDIDNVRNTDDALSNWIKSYNAKGGKQADAATAFKEMEGFVQATIRATNAANFETFTHEMIHPMLYMVDDATLDVLAKYAGLKDANELQTLRALRDAGAPMDAELKRMLYEAEEKIVNDATKHMGQEDFGIGLSGVIKGAFIKIRNVLVNLWKKIKRENQDLKFTDEVREAMDTLVLGSKDARKVYELALKDLLDEQTHQTAGTPGMIDIQLGDGQFYKTQYRAIPIKQIKDPIIPGKLLDEYKSLSNRVERFRRDHPDWIDPNKIPEDVQRMSSFKAAVDDQIIADYEKVRDQIDYDFNIRRSRDDVAFQIRELEGKLQGVIGKKRYKGRAADIRSLESQIETLRAQLSELPLTKLQIETRLKELTAAKGDKAEIAKLEAELILRTPLTNKDFNLLQSLYKVRDEAELAAAKGDKKAKTRLDRTNQSIAELSERLQRHGTPDRMARYAELSERARSILDERTRLETEKKNSLSAYEDALTRLKENMEEMEAILSSKSSPRLKDLQQRLPPDIFAEGSHIPLVSRDGTLLYDGTGIVKRLKQASKINYEEPKQKIIYTEDNYGMLAGEEIRGDNDIQPFEDSAMRIELTPKEDNSMVYVPGDRTELLNNKVWLRDNQDKYGIHLTDEQIANDDYIIVLMPDVDVRNLDDPRDLNRMLNYIKSNDHPKVFGKFADELSQYLATKPNVYAKAYIARITEAMTTLAYWDPTAEGMRGGWVSIADPRARKIEIDMAIESERNTPMLGIQPGVLDVLDYALRVSSITERTEQFAMNFIRKPIDEFWEANRTEELSDIRLGQLDQKIHKLVPLIGTEVKMSNEFPVFEDVIRGPYSDINPDVRYLIGNQMRQYKASLTEYLKQLEARRAKAAAIVSTKGGFDSKGKGTPNGDGKDIAMRRDAAYFVGEIFDETQQSSTRTSRDYIRRNSKQDNNVVMLARNSEFNGKPLKETTKTEILNHLKAGRVFIVGDMPGVDSAFITYLQEIGAQFTVYHTGKINRLADMIINTSTATDKAAPKFLQPLDNSFVYDIKELKQMYRTKQVSLQDITAALDAIITGKYDPDSGLHRVLLRAAFRENLHNKDVYTWLGVWNYEIHENRIARLIKNTDEYVGKIRTAMYEHHGDTSSVRSRATTDLWNQYNDVVEALNRTKATGLKPLSKDQLNLIKAQLDNIKKTIDAYSKIRKDNDMFFRNKANIAKKYDVDTRAPEVIEAENLRVKQAERGDIKAAPHEPTDEFAPDTEPMPEDLQMTKQIESYAKDAIIDPADVDFARTVLPDYGLTREMLEEIGPSDTIYLLGRTFHVDDWVERTDGRYDANAYMLEEYNKIIARRQPPAEPAESGYATHMMNNPTGTTPVPPMTGYAGLEVFDMDLYPLLSAIRERMRKDTRSYRIDAINNLDADTRQAFQDWLNTTRINLAETRRGAVDWGIMQRDNALLNYSNRTNLDPYMELVFPYQFWFTRNLGNWAKRMVSKPAMVGRMVRRQEMMKKNGAFWGNVPKRLQGKMVVPFAFSESWMGNFAFINPWQNLYPPFNLLSSINTFNMQAANVNPLYTLQDMVNEGSITQEEMDEAIETQSGANWDKAYARAIEENNADMKNPVTLASMMMSPSLWITELFGDKPAENLPSTKLGTAMRSFGQRVPGILGPVADMLGRALEAPEKFIRRNNFAYYGKWGEYKINRMIANMVADGTLDYDRGMLAMINKSGPDYELAQQRLESELSMKVAGSALADTIIAKEWTQIPLASLVTLFPAGLYPIGEEEGVQLKEEMTAAWDELGKGNPYPINNFFNENEGHLVRTGINDGPELQMKKFLAHNIREKYDALDPVNKGIIKVQLGDGFVNSILSGTIDYGRLTKQDLTIWLDALNGNVPETELIPQSQRISPEIFTDEEVKQITTYMNLREELYPNHAWLQQNYGQLANEIDRKKYLAKFPELKRYWDWNRKYKHDHPIIGEWSSYYGNPNVGDTYQDPFFGLDKNVIEAYLNEKRQRFPDQEWQQEVYFSLPTDEERYAFIDANPSLAKAWEWDQAIVATNPTIAMYKQLREAQYNMSRNEPGEPKTPAQVSKNLALLPIHEFAIQELVISHSTGDPLSAGTRAELLRLFQSMGEPGGNFEDWIEGLF